MEYLLQSSSWGEKPEVNHPCVLQMKLSALEIAQFLMLTATSLLPHCCQPAHSCKGEQSNSFCCRCCRKQPSACACCSAQQTAATAPTESCNAELHGRLCSVFDGLKWYMFNTPFLLCVKKLFYIFDCISWFLRSLWYFLDYSNPTQFSYAALKTYSINHDPGGFQKKILSPLKAIKWYFSACPFGHLIFTEIMKI